MKNYFNISRLLYTIFALSVLCYTTSTQAQHYEFPVPEVNASQIDANVGTGLDIMNITDPDIVQNINYSSYNPGTLITVDFDTDQPPYAKLSYTIILKIIPKSEDGTLNESLSYEQKFSIENDPHSDGGTFRETVAHRIDGAYGAAVRVVAFEGVNEDTDVTLTETPANVLLQGAFQVERYYEIAQVAPSLQTPTVLGTTDSGGNAVNKSVIISWQDIEGALGYELEYTWIDNYAPIPPGATTLPDPLSATVMELSPRDFELNNTRIHTKETSFEIPLIYASGYLIYRVRAASRFLNNTSQPFYTQWSSGTGGEVHISDWDHLAVVPHENGMNWQFQASFAEEGKKKEVVSYFDGTLRNRQTVTRINSDENAIVGEVIYDNQGRPAIEVLPTPVDDDDAIKYYPGYNINSANGAPYTHNDFDWNSTTTDDCEAQTDAMGNASGAGAYYGNQANPSGTYQDYVPDAEGFPFSQIEYTSDNTGRIRRKGGVGPTHQLGTNHEMKYYYAVPTQEELNRLFGYRVGNVQHYKKNIVVDPNGQVSISYIDPQGRTIATALAGDTPASLEGLDDEDNGSGLHGSLTVDLLNKLNPEDPDTPQDNIEKYSTGLYGPIQDGLLIARQVAVTADGTSLSFDFSAHLDSSFSPEYCSDEVYPYVFEHNSVLTDDCGNPILGPYNEIPIGTESLAGNHIPIAFEPPLLETTPLPTGTYTVDNRLTIDESTLEVYAADYREKLQDPESACYIDPSPYAPDVDLTLCDIESCDDCAEAVGPKDSYIRNGLIQFFGFEGFNVSVSGDGTITVSGYVGQVDFDGNPITANEVDLVVNRFNTEHDLLIEGCFAACQSVLPAGCVVSNISLLQDVSPIGQYGAIEIAEGEDVLDPLSVFNEDNILGDGNGTNTWRHPVISYADQYGNEAQIPVVEVTDGVYTPEITLDEPLGGLEGESYVRPEHLVNLSDFLNFWEPSWAASLISYHPESCYLDYVQAFCDYTDNVTVYDPESDTSSTQELDSDGYDSYLASISTYANAVTAGLINANTAIMDQDPYFSGTVNAVETGAFASYRQGIMEEALTINYEGLTENGQENGPALVMLQAAYLSGACNGLEDCAIPSTASAVITVLQGSTLTTNQKDIIWNTYKGNYRSVKEKIKSVFMNTYAYELGCYNGCIGGDDGGLITTVLEAYDISEIVDFINDVSTPQFCESDTADAYAEKQKRFLPVDEAYDSGVDPADAIDALEGDADYINWVQTGNCPLAVDLQIFLQGYFTQVSGAGLLANPVNGTTPYIGQYLTPDLFEALGGGNPELTTGISGNMLTVNTNTGGCSNTQIVINSPLSWGNYTLSTPSGSQWQIIGVTNVYYDEQAVLNNPENGVFAVQFVAQIQTINGFEEIIMSGTTCAAIGECGVVDDGIGDVLDDQVSDPNSPVGCTRQAQFEEAFVNLLNALKASGDLEPATPFSLSSYSAYIDSFLPEFLEDDITNSTAEWDYFSAPSTTIANYRIRLNGDVVLNMGIENSINTLNISAIESIYIEETSVGADVLSVYFSDESGMLNSYVADFKPGLNYSCCDTVVTTNNEPHIGFAFMAVNSSGLNNTSRLNIGEGAAQFINNNIGDTFYVTSYDDASNGPRIRSQQFNFNNIPIVETGIFCCGEVSARIDNGTTKVQIQNNAYTNTFSNINSHLLNNTNVDIPIDVMYYVLMVDRYTNINASRASLEALLNANKVKKAFFIILEGENGADLTSISGTPNLTPLQFVSQLLNTTPIAYNSNLGIHNSDYVAYRISDLIEPDFENTLSQFLQSGYDEVQNGTSMPGSCETCIAQAVAPVSCTMTFDQFTNATTGIATIVSDYTLPESYTQENFCNLNYGYLVDSYFEYLDILNVDSVEDDYFISIAEFGDTHLNYGYTGINAVIAAYAGFTQPTDDFVPWNTFVNDIYLENNEVCPPAPLPIGEILVDTPPPPCEEFIITVSESYEQDAYDAYLDQLVDAFKTDYINTGIGQVAETMYLTYFDKEYQYTLYYYDQAGNLVQTVSPEGVDRLDASNVALNQAIDTYRATETIDTPDDGDLLPDHTLETQYQYNSLNQLVRQETPDGGITRFAYDDLGRIIASQNDWQQPEYSSLNIVGDIPGTYNTTDNGKTVHKLTNDGNRAHSVEFMEGNGYVERVLFPAGNNNNLAVSFGLSYENSNTHHETQPWRDIDYTFYTFGTDGMRVYALGVHGGSSVIHQPGDVLKIERLNGVINFYQNEILVRSVAEEQPGARMRIDLMARYTVSKVGGIKFVDYGTGDIITTDTGRYSYTTYDGIGRITEAGEISPLQDAYRITDEGRLEKEVETIISDPDDPGSVVTITDFEQVNGFNFSGTIRKEITQTFYDDIVPIPQFAFSDPVDDSGDLFEDFNAFTLRNRVAGILYYDRLPVVSPVNGGSRFTNAIFYDYDIHGNVKELVNYYGDLYQANGDRHIRRIAYDYDLISGNVKQVTYQKGKTDQFIHKYDYDADNRITEVHTSRDGYIWERDASYEYYAHGLMARMQLGDKNVQGMDYIYTLHGWIKSVNGEYIENPTGDFGRDGLSGSLVAKDAYGYSLNYYSGDYSPVVTGTADGPLVFTQGDGIPHTASDLYNGNIKEMTTSLREREDDMLHTQVNSYTYDQLNRIYGMKSLAVVGIIEDKYASYSSDYQYDRNGNLKNLVRDVFNSENPDSELNIPMDELNYAYKEGTNRLNRVEDAIENDPFTSDIETAFIPPYDPNNTDTHDYIYDEIGQLIQDNRDYLKIDWRVDGKVNRIRKFAGSFGSRTMEEILFDYDGLGNRIGKTVIANLGEVTRTQYVRDAQGNILAVLEGKSDAESIKNNTFKSFGPKEHHIYGSSRLGIEEREVSVSRTKSKEDVSLSDENILALELSQNAFGVWDAGSIDNEPYFTNVNYDVSSNILLTEPLAVNDSLKITTLAFANSTRTGDPKNPTITYRDNYLEIYIRNEGGIYKPSFYSYRLQEGQSEVRLDVISQKGITEAAILSDGLSFNFATFFNEAKGSYDARLDFGERTEYQVGKGLIFSQYNGAIQEGINTSRLSLLGGDANGRFQIDDLAYRLTTDLNTLDDRFVFKGQEGNDILQSAKGLELTMVSNVDYWLASRANTTVIKRSFSKNVGDRRYELSNHLGNVLSVVSDKKIPRITNGVADYFNADILAYNDYYPFGMLLPGRHANTSDYRYGFNGMEKDDEIKGEGNSYTTHFRQYDPRIGRWLTVDPEHRSQPWSSPYNAFDNSPQWKNDPNGDIAPIVIWALKKLGEAALYVAIDVAIQAAIEHYIGGKDWSDIEIDWWSALGSSSEAIIPGKKAKIAASAGWDMLTYSFTTDDWTTEGFVMAGVKGGLSSLIGDKAGDLIGKYGIGKVLGFYKKLNLNPCGCFIAGTKILTKNGYENIEEVAVGDLVYAFNEKTKEIELKKVLKTFKFERDHIYKISFEEEIIEATEDHPFYVDEEWKKVKDLKVGDLLTLSNGKKSPIKEIQYVEGVFDVYNFEVEENNTYYVTKQNVLVHNSGLCDIIIRGIRSETKRVLSRSKVLSAIRKLDGDAKFGYRGSLARGTTHRGDDFSPDDFDVDAFIVSDEIASMIESAGGRANWRDLSIIDGFKGKMEALKKELGEKFEGMRDEFSIRVFTKEEFKNMDFSVDPVEIIK